MANEKNIEKKEWTPTKEQRAIIDAEGDMIVSASAGSGKTTVMIERLVRKIVLDKLSLGNVLAVTFTNKAAANMKDKLRERIGEAIAEADDIVARTKEATESADELRERLIKEYDLIATADISTIDAFCFKLVKNYFYELGVDMNSEIADDDAVADLYEEVFDDLFTGKDGESGYYGTVDENGKIENEDFATLLTYLRQKRKDDGIKKHIIEAYKSVRVLDGYEKTLADTANFGYSEQKFDELYEKYSERDKKIYEECREKIDEFERTHFFGAAQAEYERNYEKMRDFLNAHDRDGDLEEYCEEYKAPEKLFEKDILAAGIFLDDETKRYMKEYGPEYTKLKNFVQDSYNEKIATRGKRSREEESAAYFQAADIAKAFIRCLLDFDKRYAETKKIEGKLDYGDLEEHAIKLLEDRGIRDELNEKYKLVFVDEFQDVNRVQNKILSNFTGEKFYVGDQKQAIYGFRGSDSSFFAGILDDFKNRGEKGERKKALTLNTNFRSLNDIIKKVNDAFCGSMTKKICDMEYGEGHMMTGKDDEEGGRACLRPYGGGKNKSKGTEKSVPEIYSVKKATLREKKQEKDEMLLDILDEYLHAGDGAFDESDICILCRFNSQVQSATRLLIKNGYAVSGGEEDNILDNSEIRQILGILSYIDDEEQNLPMVTAMLSPLGDFTEEELAEIKVESKSARTYRDCVKEYAKSHRDGISKKIENFCERMNTLREAAKVLSAGALIDKIMIDGGMEARYSRNPDKLKRLSLVAAQGEGMTLSAFLKAMTARDAAISMPASAGADGVKIMTMHSAKGLQFKVVIVYDVSENFERNKNHTFLFDEESGFAFNAYDEKNMQSKKTLLWRSIEEKQKAENIKQELNLFYVACTRAEERLDIIVKADSIPESYDVEAAKAATNYATLIDLDKFGIKKEDDLESESKGGEEEKVEKTIMASEQAKEREGAIVAEDELIAQNAEKESFAQKIAGIFEVNHSHEYSDSPAKTTVSEAVRDDDSNARNMYGENSEYEGQNEERADGAAANEVGTAYHKFLELCDFDVSAASEIKEEIEKFFSDGSLTKEQRDILMSDMNDEIPGPAEALRRAREKIDSGSKGEIEEMYRERRFLCNLPAKIVYGDGRRDEGNVADRDDSPDEVLVQGMIDLLVRYGDGTWRIIDYKHSKKSDDALHETYDKQLELYKAAALKILGLKDENEIDTFLVNINPRAKKA